MEVGKRRSRNISTLKPEAVSVGVENDIMMHLSTEDVKGLRTVFQDNELTLQEFVAALRKRLSNRIKDPVSLYILLYHCKVV